MIFKAFHIVIKELSHTYLHVALHVVIYILVDVLIYKTHVCLVVTITPLMIHQWYIWPEDKYLIK